MNRSLISIGTVRLSGMALFGLFLVGAWAEQAGADLIYGAAQVQQGPGTLYAINSDTGAIDAQVSITVDGMPFYRVSAIDVHPETGELYATGFHEDGTHFLIIIDPATGVGTTVGTEGTGVGEWVEASNMSDLSFRDSDSALYAFLGLDADRLATIDVDLGTATAFDAYADLGQGGNAIAFAPDGTLYHAGQLLSTLDPTTGEPLSTVPLIAHFSGGGEAGEFVINAMDFHPGTGQLFASVKVAGIYHYLGLIDVVGEEVTLLSDLGPMPLGLTAIAIPPSAMLGLDIKPESCPNPFNRASNGLMPVAVVASGSYNVADIDIATLRLSRADGVGGEVAPTQRPNGPNPAIEDVGTPFGGEPCDCHDLGGDGFVDLSLKFRVQEVDAILQLDEVEIGSYIELVLTGSFFDGTPIELSDCVRVQAPPSRGKDRNAEPDRSAGRPGRRVQPRSYNSARDRGTSRSDGRERPAN